MLYKNASQINFNNTEVAFKDKSNGGLQEMRLLFKIMNIFDGG